MAKRSLCTDRATALAGMLLVAATYGMARFGVGLFAPLLVRERPGLAGVVGYAAAAQFAAYCVAALVATRLADGRPRLVVALAGATATAGCLGVAVATHPVPFVLAVLVGGMGGGFASPALVPVVDAVVAPTFRATAQSVVNTGTATGVVAAGAVSAVPSPTLSWLVMAACCAGATALVWGPVRRVPARRGERRARPSPHDAGPLRDLAVPAAAAVVAGAGSSLLWTFGPTLLTAASVVAEARVGGLWVALGLGGLAGTATGTLVARLGRRGGWAASAGALALASAGLGVAVATGSAVTAYTAMAVFGGGYMALSGVLILWARHAWPDRAGAGTALLFVALATGQALGSAALGAARGAADPVLLAALAAAACCLAALVTVPVPGRAALRPVRGILPR